MRRLLLERQLVTSGVSIITTVHATICAVETTPPQHHHQYGQINWMIQSWSQMKWRSSWRSCFKSFRLPRLNS